MAETLNLEANIKQLVIKALSRYDDKTAAEKLGISLRSLYNWKRRL